MGRWIEGLTFKNYFTHDDDPSGASCEYFVYEVDQAGRKR